MKKKNIILIISLVVVLAIVAFIFIYIDVNKEDTNVINISISELEKKIENTYECQSFTKIDDASVKVVVDECENSKSLANNIMRLVQEQFDKKMYISVQFES